LAYFDKNETCCTQEKYSKKQSETVAFALGWRVESNWGFGKRGRDILSCDKLLRQHCIRPIKTLSLLQNMGV